MIDLFPSLDALPPHLGQKLFTVLIVMLVGFLLNRLASVVAYFFLKQKGDRQRLFIIQKMIRYTLAIVLGLIILKVFEVDIKVILTAAGVFSIAVGFAAQTSVSNLISGLFLIFERPFVVGDFIEVGNMKGELLSVDLLSMRIRTVDNLLVRVPNESVMKSQVINYSFFPIRRHDLTFSLSYKEDLEKVKRLLIELVEQNPYCLDEPQPLFLVQTMGEYFLEIKFGVWGEAKNLLMLQSTFCEQVRQTFIKHSIQLPLRAIKFENQPLDQRPSPVVPSSPS